MISRVTLLNSCFVLKRKDKIQTVEPQLRIGIASIAAVLRDNGIHVEIIDPEAEGLDIDALIGRILDTTPDVLGLPGYTEEINAVHEIAASVKKRNPGITIILGGPHVTALPIDTMKSLKNLDIGVIGEGEFTLLEICKQEKPEDINGIVFRKNGEIVKTPPRERIKDLDTLPYPAWDLYPLKKYENRLPLEPLRSCPYDCGFCFRSLGNQISYKSPGKILEEMETNLKNFGINRYKFSAGTFPLGKKHALEIFDKISEAGIKVNWMASARVDALDEELLKKMKQSGCERIQLGIETADKELLKFCGKNITPASAEDVIRLCKQIGIKVGLNFILGLPHETQKTIKKTAAFAAKVGKMVESVNYAILVPFPGTKVYNMALQQEAGIQLSGKSWDLFGKQSGQALKHANFKDGELQKIQSKLYLSFYLRYPLKALKSLKFASLQGILAIVKNLIYKKRKK